MKSKGIYFESDKEDSMFDGWAIYFALAGIISSIAMFLYADKESKKLEFSFIAAGLLSLIVVPIVNVYKIQVMHLGFQLYVLPYEGYTIPLLLVGAAFFLLSSMVLLHKKIQTTTKDFLNATAIDLDKTKSDSSLNNQNKTNRGDRDSARLRRVGFSLAVLSPMSLIAAAIVYAPMGPSPPLDTVPGTSLREYTLPLAFASVAFLALGFALILYKKSKSFGFLWVASGSVVFLAAGFSYAYQTYVTELVFGYVPVGRYINPIREYTLPLFLAGVAFFTLGYVLMLKRGLQKS